jgi:hypothetical protein
MGHGTIGEEGLLHRYRLDVKNRQLNASRAKADSTERGLRMRWKGKKNRVGGSTAGSNLDQIENSPSLQVCTQAPEI